MAFEGFETRRIDGEGCEINLVIGGSGPPLLLLHGYPQTHVMWHKIAPQLADRFTVVASDLRGYGDSNHPPDGENHFGYSKRATAADQAKVMAALGFERFRLIGHDRGGRVAHRLALDHPQAVERLSVLDIVPTRTLFKAT
ncbi:MAG TPA: alpha/beta hydrolase, partial [Alphaproteobacteria bacterium]|nr:alpha/beta hydrolase [Alphaproteobacteria bacterium]